MFATWFTCNLLSVAISYIQEIQHLSGNSSEIQNFLKFWVWTLQFKLIIHFGHDTQMVLPEPESWLQFFIIIHCRIKYFIQNNFQKVSTLNIKLKLSTMKLIFWILKASHINAQTTSSRSFINGSTIRCRLQTPSSDFDTSFAKPNFVPQFLLPSLIQLNREKWCFKTLSTLYA